MALIGPSGSGQTCLFIVYCLQWTEQGLPSHVQCLWFISHCVMLYCNNTLLPDNDIYNVILTT